MRLSSSTGPGDKAWLKERLTPLQYAVTQEKETEPPFQNEYWDCEQEGLYVDVISGEPLFSSRQKLQGYGWPSFTKPIMDASVRKRGAELFARESDAYLGLMKQEGDQAYYSINSASLRLIPRERLEQEGYGDMLLLFRMR